MWKPKFVRMVRHLIDDLVEPYDLSDDRIVELLITAAYLMVGELSFDYTVDFDTIDITPSPATDHEFANLLVLKAACILDRSKLRKLGDGVYKIKDGPSNFDNTAKVDATKNIIQLGNCKLYEEAKMSYEFGNGSSGRAILGPFSSEEISVSGHPFF